jgi:hypothetical protein
MISESLLLDLLRLPLLFGSDDLRLGPAFGGEGDTDAIERVWLTRSARV